MAEIFDDVIRKPVKSVNRCQTAYKLILDEHLDYLLNRVNILLIGSKLAILPALAGMAVPIGRSAGRYEAWRC